MYKEIVSRKVSARLLWMYMSGIRRTLSRRPVQLKGLDYDLQDIFENKQNPDHDEYLDLDRFDN